MLDYQRIVDDIRASLHTATADGLDFMRAAAADYLVACDEANERLRHCGKLLKQGLRSEAIHLAEIEPILLDVVATLDFPERDQWSEAVARFGIVAPAPLLLDIAAELNQAYAAERPLAALLTRHRLLALARAPLQRRVGVLRRLAELDLLNPVWHEDLVLFERERQRQLQQELTVAAQNRDLTALATLEEELRQPWAETPPGDLLRWTAKTRAHIVQQDARASLEQIVNMLDVAFGDFDVAAGREARRQWQELSKIAALADNDPLIAWATPALDWLAEQDRQDANEAAQRAAVAAFEHALKRGRDRHDLEKLHRAATRGGHALSARLEKLYQSRLAAFAQAARRRSRTVRIAIVLATCLAGTGMILSGYLVVQSRQAEARIAALVKLIDAGKFGEAHDLVTRLKKQFPGLDADERMKNQIDRLNDLEHQDAEHQQLFDTALAAVTAGGLDHPDELALRKAEQLARTDGDRARLLETRGKISAHQRKQRELRESQLDDELKQLAARVAELEQPGTMSAAERAAAITVVRAEIAVIDKKSAGLSQALRDRAAPLLTRLDSLAVSLHAQQDLHGLERALTAAVGDRDRYRTALQAFIAKFPNDPRSKSYQQVLSEATLWQEIDAWNAFLDQWGDNRHKPANADAAQGLANAIKSFCDDHPDWPSKESLMQRLPYLTAIVKRDGTDQPLHEAIDRLLTDTVVASVWMVELKDGRRFYARTMPASIAATHTVHFKYITGFDMGEKARDIKAAEVAITAVAAPQNALAQQAAAVLNQLDGTNWDHSFKQLLDVLLQKDDPQAKVDPLLRLMLVQQTLDIATKGSYCLECAFEKQLKLARDSNVSAVVNWLDPDDAQANSSRPQATRELKALRESIGNVGEIIAERQAAFHAPLGKKTHWIGLLRQPAAGVWQCATPAPPPLAGRLAVVVASGDKVKVREIGHATPQGLKIDKFGTEKTAFGMATIPLPLLEGRPVFLIAP